MSAFLPDETRISQVHLRTGNLERALGFYTSVLGLRILQRLGPQATLSAAESHQAMIALREESGAAPSPRQSIGLTILPFAIRRNATSPRPSNDYCNTDIPFKERRITW